MKSFKSYLKEYGKPTFGGSDPCSTNGWKFITGNNVPFKVRNIKKLVKLYVLTPKN